MAAYSFIFISLIDPLHNGAGEGLGMIDRPIIRERATTFPLIQPTSLKGVLRDEFTRKFPSSPDEDKVIATFGPKPGGGDKHNGASAFGEGQLLAFPIRSLKGYFVWGTSRLALHRLHEKLTIAGILPTMPQFTTFMSALQTNHSANPIIPDGSSTKLLIDKELMLEEFSYPYDTSSELQAMATELGALIFPNTPYLQTEFATKLVLLPDDVYSHFVTHATEVLPNIAINTQGTSTEGLRFTEYLPRDAVMFSLVSHEKPRMSPHPANCGTDGEVKTFFDTNLPQRIQVGGDETTGKGLVSLAWI